LGSKEGSNKWINFKISNYKTPKTPPWRSPTVSRRYCVSVTGLDEETIRECIGTQEEMDRKLDQLKMFE
jgi:hypothetical protein